MPEPVPGFAIGTREDGERLLVTPRGELDLATAPQLEQVLLESLAAGRAVRLDLRELAFMDSTGVRVLVAAHHAAPRDGGSLEIVRPAQGAPVDRVLEISGIADQLGMVAE